MSGAPRDEAAGSLDQRSGEELEVVREPGMPASERTAAAGALAPPMESKGDAAIALLLRGGVFAAAGLLGAALAGSLLLGVPLQGQGAPLHEVFAGQAPLFESFAQLGILALGITPVARVLLSIPIFAREGDRSQAWIGIGVLVLLAASMLLGFAEGG